MRFEILKRAGKIAQCTFDLREPVHGLIVTRSQTKQRTPIRQRASQIAAALPQVGPPIQKLGLMGSKRQNPIQIIKRARQVIQPFLHFSTGLPGLATERIKPQRRIEVAQCGLWVSDVQMHPSAMNQRPHATGGVGHGLVQLIHGLLPSPL